MFIQVVFLASLAFAQNCPPELGVKTVQLSHAQEIWPDLEHCELISRTHFDSLENTQLYALPESKPLSKALSNLPLRSFAQLNDAPAEGKPPANPYTPPRLSSGNLRLPLDRSQIFHIVIV